MGQGSHVYNSRSKPMAMSERERALAEALQKAAVAWWESHRPLVWTEADHIANPTINAQTASDRALMQAVCAALATPLASPSVCPHCELPAVLPEVCTPEIGAIIERNIERDWGILNTGYEIGKKSASPSVCEWREDEGMWTTGCGKRHYQYEDGDPRYPGWPFCPYCGKPLSLPTPEVQS